MSQIRMTSFEHVLAALPAFKTAAPAAGPVLVHCAESIECSVSSFPSLRSALFRATIGRLAKKKFLSSGAMKHDTGAGLPGQPPIAGNAAPPEGVARLERAIASFRAYDGPLAIHPAYGLCTKA